MMHGPINIRSFVRFDILTKANIKISSFRICTHVVCKGSKIWRNLVKSFPGQSNRISLTDLVGIFRIFGNFLLICIFFISEDNIIKVFAYSSHSYIARRMPFQITRLNQITLTAFGEQQKL